MYDAAMDRTKLIIDTDAGDDVDDVLAIAFAALRPEIDLLGVTTVTLDARRRAALVRQVLDAAGRGDVPVAAGMQLPLKPITAEQRQKLADERRMNHCPVEPLATCGDALDLMIRLIEAHPGEVSLVGIGPLTNIASLMCRRPDLLPAIKAIAVMGGEVDILRVEHNIASDDIAAAHVLGGSFAGPVFLGTWSVTRQVVLTHDHCSTITARGTPLCRLLADCIAKWHPHQSWKPGPVMYDLAPIVWAFDPSHFVTKPMHLAVETRGEATRGMTVPRHGEPHVHVSQSLDAPALHRMLMDTLTM